MKELNTNQSNFLVDKPTEIGSFSFLLLLLLVVVAVAFSTNCEFPNENLEVGKWGLL